MRTNLKYLVFALMFFSFFTVPAQISVPEYLNTEMPESRKMQIINSLDSLLAGIERGEIDNKLVDQNNLEFNLSHFKSFRGIESKDTIKKYYQGQLINLYPISASEYSVTVAYLSNKDENPVLGGVYTFIAKADNDRIVFSSPMFDRTKSWKTTVVGDITIHYPDTINLKRAEDFESKNRIMATKLGLPVMKFELYMCRNFQEILYLLGCDYDSGANGRIDDGYIVNSKVLFSIMNNEDFSHDAFHIYTSKIRTKRNRTVEEGVAYSWGNAYYASPDGEIATQKQLVLVLQAYLRENPLTDLIDLFTTNPVIFPEFSEKISVKSVISGVICDEVERQKGSEGIIELVKCGAGDDNFFETLNSLIQINRENFNEKVMPLVMQKN